MSEKTLIMPAAVVAANAAAEDTATFNSIYKLKEVTIDCKRKFMGMWTVNELVRNHFMVKDHGKPGMTAQLQLMKFQALVQTAGNCQVEEEQFTMLLEAAHILKQQAAACSMHFQVNIINDVYDGVEGA